MRRVDCVSIFGTRMSRLEQAEFEFALKPTLTVTVFSDTPATAAVIVAVPKLLETMTPVVPDATAVATAGLLEVHVTGALTLEPDSSFGNALTRTVSPRRVNSASSGETVNDVATTGGVDPSPPQADAPRAKSAARRVLLSVEKDIRGAMCVWGEADAKELRVKL